MMGAILLQRFTGPQPGNAPDVAVGVEADPTNGDSPLASPETSGDQDHQPSAAADDQESTSGSGAPDSDADPDADTSDAESPDEQAPEAAPAETGDAESAQEASAVEPPAEDDFVKLGSLDPDGRDRYLITLNRLGGTIHQVELNARKENGRYRYRDLVFEGGYLGSTNFQNASDGLRVTAVGKGTPAQLAGLQPDDRLINLNGEPVVTADEIPEWLNQNTRPGDTLELGIERGGRPMTLTAELTEKPIAIIRPEGDRVDPDFDFPESFLLSLVVPQDYRDKAWPEVDRGMKDAQWELVDNGDPQSVELKYVIPESVLAEQGLAGPLTVFKRYRLPDVDPENPYQIDARSFHINLEIEIRNESDQPIDLAYELDGPTGTTAETWWFSNKIHGRQTALFYVAGARDVVGSTAANSYVFYGCPEIVKDANKERPEVHFISDPNADDPASREVRFLGVDSHYFNVSLLPVTENDDWFEVNSADAYPTSNRGRLPDIPNNARLQKLVDCTFHMVAPASLPAEGSYVQSFDIFCGPKDPALLDDYGLSDTRTFGWFSWCSIVLLEILHFFYWITLETSYGLAIVLLTVLVRCIMIPFSRKAALNAQMMQHLAPQMKEIADKYKDDMEKRAAAQRDLYKKYNFNPFGGCFMMFFQLPIFYGLYKGLNVDIALRDQPLIPGMSWCSNLAAPDQLLYWKTWMPGWLADETGYLGPYLNILPLVTMVLFIAQQRLFTPPPTDEQQQMMQRMMTFMMLFMGIMFFKVPAGLCIYFITSSLWGIVERKLLPKPTLDTDKLATVEGGKVPTLTRKQKRIAEKAEQERVTGLADRKRRNAERKKKLKNREQP